MKWRIFSRRLFTLSREKSDTLLLLVACTLVLLPHVAHLSWWISLTCALLLFWRAVITLRGQRLPPGWLLLPLAIVTTASVYFTTQTLLGREAGVTMLVLLLTFKLLEMRARRDAFVVLFLSFFLLLTTLFYSQSIATALLIVTTVVVLLTAQLSFQFAAHAPSLFQRLRMAGLMLALAVPLTLVLFIVFPRIQGPLWGMPSDAHGGRTGLSDRMEPGNISTLAQSEEIAFRVKFLDPAPPPDQRYWRGAVLDRFDGRTWTQAQSPLTSPLVPPLTLKNTHADQPNIAGIRQQITMEPSGQQWLFALETPVLAPNLEDAHSNALSNNRAAITDYNEIVTEHVITEQLRYDVTSQINDIPSASLKNLSALMLATTLPSAYNPRTMAFATTLRTQYGNDAALIAAALKFFHHEKFSYTLEPPLLGKDSIDDFLFSTRAGFCEHYASAFVVLMRSAGIPARVVTGYQGGEINPVDEMMTIRQSDAHAWAEVWLQAQGWTRVDPTAAVAPSRIHLQRHAAMPSQSFLGDFFNFNNLDNLDSLNFKQGGWQSTLLMLRAEWKNHWDALGNGWTQWVLNYTQDRQKNLLQTVLSALKIEHSEQYDGRKLMSLLLALMLTLGAIALAVVTVPMWLIARKVEPLDALYSALCKRMVKYGVTKKDHEGPTTFRRRLCAQDSPLSPDTKNAVTRFLKLYEMLRYSENTASNGATIRSPQFKKLKYLLSLCR